MAHRAPREVLHHPARGLSDRIALALTKFLRLLADTFFAKRYGHRAVVLETVAGVPGMVGGMMNHLKSLRLMRDDEGWIKTLLDEAENERMHLMTFIALFKPSLFERVLLMVTQAIFWNAYFFLYLFSPKTAHRMVGYFEEEAVFSYTAFLNEIDAGRMENVPAPKIAIDYLETAGRCAFARRGARRARRRSGASGRESFDVGPVGHRKDALAFAAGRADVGDAVAQYGAPAPSPAYRPESHAHTFVART